MVGEPVAEAAEKTSAKSAEGNDGCAAENDTLVRCLQSTSLRFSRKQMGAIDDKTSSKFSTEARNR
jgi:hypothetical protein